MRTLRDEFRQQLACDLGLLAAAVEVIQNDSRIECAPVRGQHPVVHAATTIQQDKDFRAASGALDLGLRSSRGCERQNAARERKHCKDGPQPADDSADAIDWQLGERRKRERIASFTQQWQ